MSRPLSRLKPGGGGGGGGGEKEYGPVTFQNFHWHCIIKRYWVKYRADWPSDKTFVSALSVKTRAEGEA